MTLPAVALSRRWHFARDQAISFLMQQGVENPGVISLAAGLVDYASLPVNETRSALQRLLSDEPTARLALQYGTTPGAEPIRQAKSGRLPGSPSRPPTRPARATLGSARV